MSKEVLFSITKKDLIIKTCRSGGKGGQHQNKTDSAVQITHPESGATAESRSERSQYMNKKIALQRLVEHPKFKMWINQKVMEVDTGKTAEQRVEESMTSGNLKIEVRNEEGKWEDEKL